MNVHINHADMSLYLAFDYAEHDLYVSDGIIRSRFFSFCDIQESRFRHFQLLVKFLFKGNIFDLFYYYYYFLHNRKLLDIIGTRLITLSISTLLSHCCGSYSMDWTIFIGIPSFMRNFGALLSLLQVSYLFGTVSAVIGSSIAIWNRQIYWYACPSSDMQCINAFRVCLSQGELKNLCGQVMGDGEEQGVVKIADFGLARIYQAPLKPLSENGVGCNYRFFSNKRLFLWFYVTVMLMFGFYINMKMDKPSWGVDNYNLYLYKNPSSLACTSCLLIYLYMLPLVPCRFQSWHQVHIYMLLHYAWEYDKWKTRNFLCANFDVYYYRCQPYCLWNIEKLYDI